MKPLLIIVLLLTLPSCGYQHFTKPGVSSYTQQEDEMRCESLAYQQATALHGQNSMMNLQYFHGKLNVCNVLVILEYADANRYKVQLDGKEF
jgi:hypothetical protein